MTTPLAHPAASPVVHASRRLLRTFARPMAWFWAIVLAAVVVITAILAAAG